MGGGETPDCLRGLDCQSNAKPAEKDHDLPGIWTRDLWSSSQHTQPLHYLSRRRAITFDVKRYNIFAIRIEK
jgi:hypothetical protein